MQKNSIDSRCCWLPLIGLAIVFSTVTGARDAGAQAVNRPSIVEVCAPCHGTDGAGRDVETPNLAGQSGIYLYNQLIAFRKGTRQHPPMKGIARQLTDNEINAIVSYYAILPPP
jgi:cytochrome c553